jgi:hypothetical protein
VWVVADLRGVPFLPQVSLTGPLAIGVAPTAAVRVIEHGPVRSGGPSPTGRSRVIVSFDAPLAESLSLMLPLAVLRHLIAASSPLLVPLPGACAPGGGGDG